MNEKVITGAELFEKQVKSGVRPILEALDKLRISLGSECVTVLTPKAETRMRTGYKAEIPIKARICVQGKVKECKFFLDMLFSAAFPDEKLEIIPISFEGIDWLPEKLEKFKCDLNKFQSILESELPDPLKLIGHIVDLIDEKTGIEKEENLKLNPTISQFDKADKPLCLVTTCKICRNVLTDKTIALSDHSVDWQHSSKCTSLFFTELPAWNPSGDDTKGKLCCSKCGNRVGHWSWVGAPCSCGIWVSPAIQFTISKIDIRR